MSAITSQYGDSFINGLLAGKKFQALDEEVKRSRLERMDYEMATAYREQKRALDLELGKSEINRSKLASEGDLLQKQLLELDLASRPELNSAKLEETRAGTAAQQAATKRSNQGTSFDADLQPLRIKQAESELSRASLDQVTAGLTAGKGLGRSLVSKPTLADAMTMAGGLGVKDPSAQNLIAQALLGGVEEKEREVALNQATTDKYRQDAMKDQIFNLFSAAAAGPEGADAVGQFLNDNKFGAAAATVARGLPDTRKNMSPGEIKESEAIGKSIGEVRAMLSDKKRELKRLESGGEPAGSKGYYWTTAGRREDEIKAKKLDIETTQEQLDSLKESSGSKSTSSLDDALKSLGFTIKSTATDAELREAVDYLASRGVKTTIEELRRRKGK